MTGLIVFINCFVAIISANARAQNIADDDERCFLEGGVSTETFFVKESLSTGGAIGSIRVIGDVGKDIRIEVVEDANQTVAIRLNTKDLILSRSLDKEEVDGPASVAITVMCERIDANESPFLIPVNIKVTDVNDNAPEFDRSNYQLNISELTLPGSRIFMDGFNAVDLDQPGPFSTVEYSVAPGRLSDYVAFENPLDGDSLVLVKDLDFETLKSFQVRIIARDQGSPPRQSETLLTINVQDADDQNPAFFHDEYDALLPDSDAQGQKLLVNPQDIRAFDKDMGIRAPVFYEFNGDPNDEVYKYFELNKNTGHIYIKANIPEEAFLQPRTLVVKATQFDNPDRYALTMLTVSRGGIFHSNLQFIQKVYKTDVLENAPLNSVIVTLITNRPSDRRVRYEIDAASLPGGEFSVSEKGEIVLRKTLDFETQESFNFTVSASDGHKNDTSRVEVHVLNINDWDPRFKYPEYEFFVSAKDAFDGFVVGKVEVHDGDKGDQVSLQLRGTDARAFSINPQGELSIQNMRFLNSTKAHLVIIAEDSGIPSRQASVAVLVKFAEGITAFQRDRQTWPLDNAMVVVIFSALTIFFLVVIVVLSIYICKYKGKWNDHLRIRNYPIHIDSIDAKIARNNEYHRGRLLMQGPKAARLDNPLFNYPSRQAQTVRRSSSSSIESSSPEMYQYNPTVSTTRAINPLNPNSYAARQSRLPPSSINSNGLPEPRMAEISEHPMPGSSHRNSPPDPIETPNKPASSAAPPPPPPPPPPPSQVQSQNVLSKSKSHGQANRNGSVNSLMTTSSMLSAPTVPMASELSLHQTLRKTIFAGSSNDLVTPTRIQWPSQRRNKKLSWQEQSRDREISTFMTDPYFSVTPYDDDDEHENRDLSRRPQIGSPLYF